MLTLIQPIGRYFQLDEQGFVLNDTRSDAIPIYLNQLLETITAAYQATYGDALHSVWLRGSLARGLFVQSISDIDTFALVYQANIRWKNVDLVNFDKSSFPFEVECCISSFSETFTQQNPALAMQIQTQAHCLWGKDIRTELPKHRPSKTMAMHYKWLVEDIQAFLIQKRYHPKDSQAILKLLLRSGFELVMPRLGRYTPDLYYCYISFACYYPDKELLMREILWHYLNPLDFERIVYLVRTLGTWMLKEYEDF